VTYECKTAIKLAMVAIVAGIISMNDALTSGASAANSTVLVTCVPAAKTDAGSSAAVCKELTAHLSKVYPGHHFIVSTSTQQRSGLDVTVAQATEHALSLKLKWTTVDGRVVVGEEMSLVVMDHTLTPVMRHALYDRLISATPMP
jgi:hypothetical protein